MRLALAIGLAVLPGVVTAQEALPTIGAVMADLQDSEVYVVGALGLGSHTPVTDVWLVLPDGTEVPVVMALDEPVGARLKGCFYSPGHGGTPCAIKGYGFVEWSGATLQLTLTGIEDISPPAALE